MSFKIVKNNYEGKYNRKILSYVCDFCIFGSLIIQVLGIFFELEPLRFCTTPLLLNGPIINNKQYGFLKGYFKMEILNMLPINFSVKATLSVQVKFPILKS